jgi:mono/diheme cytochrome c family protein
VPVDNHDERQLDPPWLQRSLDRHFAWGLFFMVVLLGSYVVYQWREPHLRAEASTTQSVSSTSQGRDIFANRCATCHGDNASGGQTAPTLNSKQFLEAASDPMIRNIVSAGIPGTAMPTWSIEFGGALTQQQIDAVVSYLRSLEAKAPSIPNWREAAQAK